MMVKDNFLLIGHLQVMEEPLSSLYINRTSGQFYLFVRLFEQSDVCTFLLAQVTPLEVVDYMEGKIGLKAIFGKNKSYYYKYQNNRLCTADFQPLTSDSAHKKLENDGLSDKFDRQLSYQMVPLKQYLKTIV